MNKRNIVFLMNKHSVSFLFLIFLVMYTGKIVAQTKTYDQFSISVNGLNMLSINTSPSPVSMTLSTSIAGSPISPATNSNMYLKVTSIVATGSTRKITAMISSGSIPTGTILKLVSAACASINSVGSVGSPIATAVTLNKTASQTIIDGIGSCYTGTSTTDGYNLTFTWQPDNTKYYLITAPTNGSTTVTITFTLASNN
jgi:hypothetical protein